MNNPKPLTNEEGEVRELNGQDFAAFKPAHEVLPPTVYAMLTSERKMRCKNKKPTKTQVSIRLDADVLAALKATGKGWQTRINETIRAAVLPKS